MLKLNFMEKKLIGGLSDLSEEMYLTLILLSFSR
jgi:hypothetical protein